jgi:signal transduction histidine kinase
LLLLQPSGVYRLAGAAGLDQATQTALDALACRIPVTGFPSEEFAQPAVGNSLTLQLNLEPWLTPGDDLMHLRFTSTLGVPMQGREATEGVLLLAGMRDNDRFHVLRSEDLLPLEMLTARLQAARSQTTMLEKLIDSEKFAGLGQLAGNVTQQLNNPLTVILGYASLLEETSHLDDHERKGIEAILSEARHMRSTLQRLSKVARSPVGPRAAISVPELLADMEHLHRSEFLQRSIEFRLSVSPSIPRVLCHAQQLRQAVPWSRCRTWMRLRIGRFGWRRPRTGTGCRSWSRIQGHALIIPSALSIPTFRPRAAASIPPGWASACARPSCAITTGWPRR